MKGIKNEYTKCCLGYLLLSKASEILCTLLFMGNETPEYVLI